MKNTVKDELLKQSDAGVFLTLVCLLHYFVVCDIVTKEKKYFVTLIDFLTLTMNQLIMVLISR